jgi:hypothetical protein
LGNWEFLEVSEEHIGQKGFRLAVVVLDSEKTSKQALLACIVAEFVAILHCDSCTAFCLALAIRAA